MDTNVIIKLKQQIKTNNVLRARLQTAGEIIKAQQALLAKHGIEFSMPEDNSRKAVMQQARALAQATGQVVRA